MNPFDIINNICFDKKELFDDPQTEKDYNAFLINRGLSYFADTILYANEMNIHYELTKEQQFKFLNITIPKKKRFSKWNKKESLSMDISLVMEFYNCSSNKAQEYLQILSDDQIKNIEMLLDKGGV